eukprot:3353-Heterococcus_DN1.PRE.12
MQCITSDGQQGVNWPCAAAVNVDDCCARSAVASVITMRHNGTQSLSVTACCKRCVTAVERSLPSSGCVKYTAAQYRQAGAHTACTCLQDGKGQNALKYTHQCNTRILQMNYRRMRVVANTATGIAYCSHVEVTQVQLVDAICRLLSADLTQQLTILLQKISSYSQHSARCNANPTLLHQSFNCACKYKAQMHIRYSAQSRTGISTAICYSAVLQSSPTAGHYRCQGNISFTTNLRIVNMKLLKHAPEAIGSSRKKQLAAHSVAHIDTGCRHARCSVRLYCSKPPLCCKAAVSVAFTTSVHSCTYCALAVSLACSMHFKCTAPLHSLVLPWLSTARIHCTYDADALLVLYKLHSYAYVFNVATADTVPITVVASVASDHGNSTDLTWQAIHTIPLVHASSTSDATLSINTVTVH